MTQKEAWHIIFNYHAENEPERDKPVFEDACHTLMDQYGDYQAAVDLGGKYYSDQNYDLALKYYSIAAEHDIPYGYIGLGYIWYYGRTGTTDYQKAFECFPKALKLLSGYSIDDDSFWNGKWKISFDSEDSYIDYINTVYKLADMYRNGYYVVKDNSRYIRLITYLHDMMITLSDTGMPDYNLPEIDLRMADIMLNYEEPAFAEDHALHYLSEGRYVMEQRLYESDFFGDFNIMKDIVLKIYQITEFNPEDMDLYDLYYVMKKPCKVTFDHDDKTHFISAEKQKNEIVINADHKWFHSIDEFMIHGDIDGERIPDVNDTCDHYSLMTANTWERA